MNSWCRWTHPRTKHDDLRFQCVTHIRVRVGFSHVLVFFCFATLLENYGTIVVDVYCFYCTTEKENSSLSPENGAEKKGEKRRFWYSQQIAKKELLTFINVGIYTRL